MITTIIGGGLVVLVVVVVMVVLLLLWVVTNGGGLYAITQPSDQAALSGQLQQHRCHQSELEKRSLRCSSVS